MCSHMHEVTTIPTWEKKKQEGGKWTQEAE